VNEYWRRDLVTAFAVFGVCYGMLTAWHAESDPELIMGDVLIFTMAFTVLGVLAHGLIHLLTKWLPSKTSLARKDP
jgi:hypothetical protein